ncbi:hypothetical protein [Streptomyces sp. NPDC001089]
MVTEDTGRDRQPRPRTPGPRRGPATARGVNSPATSALSDTVNGRRMSAGPAGARASAGSRSSARAPRGASSPGRLAGTPRRRALAVALDQDVPRTCPGRAQDVSDAPEPHGPYDLGDAPSPPSSRTGASCAGPNIRPVGPRSRALAMR